MNLLLSIIVPTKDRYEYLEVLVDLFYSIKDERIQLVLQDNSDKQSDAFIEKLNKINDNRIKYQYNPVHLPIDENCNAAIFNSDGKYVTMIGDDDGFIPELIYYVSEMDKRGFDVLLPQKAYYMWPDVVSKHYTDIIGSVTLRKLGYNLIEINPLKELKTCLSNGARDMYNMPRLYHAVVSRNYLDLIYKKTNNYFPGPSPDMANAVALSLFNPKTFLIKLPLIISGKGYKSSGAAGLRKAHVGKIEGMRFLPKNTVRDWEANIPRIWTGPTVYAESAIKALKNCKEDQWLKKFNYIRFYANFTGKRLQYFKYVKKKIKLHQYPKFIYYYIAYFILRIKFYKDYIIRTKFKKISKKFIYYREMKNIKVCANKISKTVKI